mmetsp:Transcript_9148/g.21956  ORF Transcript_9148/g.21956 Transcript_9148/m.21956 type:complete len:296 (+) Transcript_9148:1892-2779(+)
MMGASFPAAISTALWYFTVASSKSLNFMTTRVCAIFVNACNAGSATAATSSSDKELSSKYNKRCSYAPKNPSSWSDSSSASKSVGSCGCCSVHIRVSHVSTQSIRHRRTALFLSPDSGESAGSNSSNSSHMLGPAAIRYFSPSKFAFLTFQRWCFRFAINEASNGRAERLSLAWSPFSATNCTMLQQICFASGLGSVDALATASTRSCPNFLQHSGTSLITSTSNSSTQTRMTSLCSGHGNLFSRCTRAASSTGNTLLRSTAPSSGRTLPTNSRLSSRTFSVASPKRMNTGLCTS